MVEIWRERGGERQTKGRTEVRPTCVLATSMGFLPIFCRFQTRHQVCVTGDGGKGRRGEGVRSGKPHKEKKVAVTVDVR